MTGPDRQRRPGRPIETVEWSAVRERFVLDDLVYLDGNSLGRPLRASLQAVQRALVEEWAIGLIESWEVWIDRCRDIGEVIGRTCLGAAPGTTTLSDSTTVNLWKVLAPLVRHQLAHDPNRRTIVVDDHDFPTDRYVVDSVADAFGLDVRRTSADPIDGLSAADLAAAMGPDVAAVVVSHVNYRSGALLDLSEATRIAHDAGAVLVTDVSHSVGAVPIHTDAWGVDATVGCTYKYLNGGPGAPAFVSMAPRWAETLEPTIAGWFGTTAQFEMHDRFEAAPGIDRFQAGTPPILSVTAVGPAIELVDEVGIDALRSRSLELTSHLIEAADQLLVEHGVQVTSPRDPARRGGHVTLTHPQARQLSLALRADGIVGDYREPDGLRLAPVPTYNTLADIDRAVARIASLLRTGDHLDVTTTSRVT